MDVKAWHFDSDTCQKVYGQSQLQEGGEAVIEVNLKRINHQYPLRVNMIKTLKTKDASWWVVIGNLRTNTLLSINKVFFKNTLKKNIQVQLPQDFTKDTKLDVFFISDSYLGLDQIHFINLK